MISPGVVWPLVFALCLVWQDCLAAETSASAAASEASAAELFPDNTAAFVRIRNGRNLGEKSARSNFGRMLADPRMKPLSNQLQGVIVKAAAALEKHTGKPLDQLMQLFAGEIAFGIVARDGYKAQGLLLVDFGDQAPQALSVVKQVESQLEASEIPTEKFSWSGLDARWLTRKEGGGRGICYAFSGSRLLAASDLSLFKQVFTKEALEEGEERRSPLKELGDFASLANDSRAMSGEEADVFWYADPIALIRSLMQNNPAAAVGLTFLPFTGLDGIRSVGGGMSMEDGDYEGVQRLNLVLDAPREGLLKALAFEPASLEPPIWAPASLASYSSGKMNPNLFFSGICSTVDGIPGVGGKGSAGRFIQKGFDAAEVNFQEELLPLLDGRFYHCTLFLRPVTMQSGSNVIGLGVKDVEKTKALIKKMLSKFPERFQESVRGEDAYFSLKLPDSAPRENPQGFQPPQPCIGVLGEELVMTDRIASMEQIVAVRSDAQLGLASSLEFKLIRSRVETSAHGKKMVIGGYSRPEEGMRYWFEMASSKQNRDFLDKQAENNPFMKDLGQALNDYPLPPFEELQQYFAPAGFFVTEDESGLHHFEFTLSRAAGAAGPK